MTNKEAIKRRYKFGNGEFNLEAAYHDCKLVFDGITDDSFQEADTGLILYYANEIIYALHEALEGKDIDVSSNDTISRQAAIELYEQFQPYIAVKAVDFKKALEQLPSAQPEQRWILSGKKPLKEGSYLVWMPFAPPKHRMAVAEYCGGYWNIKTPISAWMSLPEPYNAERRTDGEETDRKTNHFKTVDIYL